MFLLLLGDKEYQMDSEKCHFAGCDELSDGSCSACTKSYCCTHLVGNGSQQILVCASPLPCYSPGNAHLAFCKECWNKERDSWERWFWTIWAGLLVYTIVMLAVVIL